MADKRMAMSMMYLYGLGWYAIFGFLHELSHLITASMLSIINPIDNKWKLINWIDLVLNRRIQFKLDHDSCHVKEEIELFIVRQSGWVASIVIALIVHFLCNRHHLNKKVDRSSSFSSSASQEEYHHSADCKLSYNLKWCQLAAYVTVIDAIWTDLLQMKPFLPALFFDNHDVNDGAASKVVTFFCGNFGIILLHSAWLDGHGGKSAALDILRKMIEITMMRGAQSGGIVTFEGGGHSSQQMIQLKSIRSRVVKSKRGDLSKLLIARLKRDAFSMFSKGCTNNSCNRKVNNITSSTPMAEDENQFVQSPNGYANAKNVRFFAGHTRFATSSKANLDGTHPHQWTPPKQRRVYNFDTTTNMVVCENSHVDLSGRRFRRTFQPIKPINITVENFITHNGDFDFYELNGTTYDVETIQNWLAIATGSKIPTVVDSAAIAGMVDIIRCKGCFALSCRYAISLGLPSSTISSSDTNLPTESQYNQMGMLFEEALDDLQKMHPLTLNALGDDREHREAIARKATDKINQQIDQSSFKSFARHINNNEDGRTVYNFAKATVDAFFDNDLLQTVKIFLKHAVGSFGLCVMSSLDAHSQMCLAARGQTISIAFYPHDNLICYGSEQAAVKAGMLHKMPGNVLRQDLSKTHLHIDDDIQRLDLDDVGGEICLIDWSGKDKQVSQPNRAIKPHKVMNNKVMLYLIQESRSHSQPQHLYHRQTKLNHNSLILPLPEDSNDPILQDLRDIPNVCARIQSDWRNTNNNGMFSLNRLTAVNLGRRIKQRLDGYLSGTLHGGHGKVDILLTGCEVSLWLSEQFASDLQKAFPRLCTRAISSNKLLGLFGQEDINLPSVGFPISDSNLDLHDTIIIIVSHSGGTFGPLACSSLLQSMTKNIFLVTSEWDTQVGRQLRSMNEDTLFDSHIFTTGVGIRAAEPCSISVVATHQLLTNIFQYISITLLSNDEYRQFTGAVITEKDLQMLERCNRDNVFALEEIVGIQSDKILVESVKEKELRKAGDIWSEHVLENAKAYMMSFVYIFATVISGFPLVSGVAHAIGLSSESTFLYLTRLFDAMIYFFLPQINVIILRLIQKRPLRHRMVGRTVVIGDIPWVAQAAEAFLSKIFACSYSIAGINVHSANPSDHLVHRMTHRVVRGTLLCCGRPDGRLSALTVNENAVSLSINQASSIQSIGSTCETVTIGHNEFKLPLSTRAIFLNRHRPLFLCEYLLAQKDNTACDSMDIGVSSRGISSSMRQYASHTIESPDIRESNKDTLLNSMSKRLISSQGKHQKTNRSSAALLGQYKSIEREILSKRQHGDMIDVSGRMSPSRVIDVAIQEKKWITQARRLFEHLNVDSDGKLKRHEFLDGLSALNCECSNDELSVLFSRFQNNEDDSIYFDDFFNLMSMHKLEVDQILYNIRDAKGIVQVGPSTERFFGESLLERKGGKNSPINISFGAIKSQHFIQELYESRIASMQRFVAMTVMFHQMGSRVQNFFASISLGLLGYRIDRSHSIMRIATTASPVSGAEIRDKAEILTYMRTVRHSINVISCAWLDYKERMENGSIMRSSSYASFGSRKSQN